MTFPVLVVDDDDITREVFATACRAEGYQVSEARTVAEAWSMCLSIQPSVIVLDLMLPDASGYEIIRHFRSFRFGILVVSAKGDPLDRVLALELGADDFMVKPVNLRELVVRIRRIHERLFSVESSRSPDAIFQFAEYVLNMRRQELTYAGDLVDLTRGQFRLLELLVTNSDRTLSRAQIAKALYGYVASPENRSIDVLVSKLRGQLAQFGGGDQFIKSVRGVGYMFSGPIATERPEGAAKSELLAAR